MTLRLQGSTAGYVEIDSPAVGGNNTVLLPSSNGSANQFLKNGSTAGTLGWSSLVEDSSGRLLVGTSSSSTVSRAVFQGNSSDPNQNADVYIQSATAPASVLGDASLGVLSFAASGNRGAYIQSSADANWSASSFPTRLAFATVSSGTTAATERMRISSAGRVEIGSAIGQNSGILQVKSSATNESIFHSYSSNANFNNDVATFSADRNTTNGSYKFLTCVRQGAAFALYILDSGNVQNANNSYTGISDIKLKENIVDANSQWADIKALRVRNYNFKEETGHSTHKQIGLVAQEVEQICPHLVDEAPDRDFDGTDLGTTTKGVNYSVLYMKAIKALQEAQLRIETLEASNADLAARLAALEAQS